MNVVDAVAAVVVLIGLLLGYRAGGVQKLAGLIGAVAGVAAVLGLGLLMIESLDGWDPLTRTVLVVGSLIMGFFVGQGVGAAIGRRIADGREDGFLGTSNKLVGAGLGGLQALVLIWLIGGLITMAPDPRLAQLAQRSTAVQTLAQFAPPPASVAADLSEQFASSGLPQLFSGIAPIPATPAELPSGSRAQAIAAAASPATVKVVSSGCGGQGSGSGVSVSRGYVVSNAHVIAGGNFVQVESLGRRYEAVPVKVDSKLDLAVLWVPDLAGPSLAFSKRDPERGDKGVALGYPGGGSLTAVRASVNREILAQGRDVYGGVPVVRDVLELNAKVNPGNSGGPLVMTDGTIGGIIFAESPSDKRVGYALAAEEVESAVRPALGRTAPVSTGSCQ
ncbi:MAG: MarP family serine protease [Actinomycetia bacterium]|nr:MarP family serine protease [Actinomycetes bacterium]